MSNARTFRDNRRRVVKFLGEVTEETGTLEVDGKAASEREECWYSGEGFSKSEDMTDFS